MNQWISRLAHRVYYRAKRSPVPALLRQLERDQWLPAAEIQERQFERLREIVRYAGEKVPFYRERFARAGFDPRSFRDPAELRRIPTLTKADIRGAGDSILSTDYRREDLLPYDSGGSTGEPVTIRRAQDDLDLSMATLRRQYRWYGFDVGDRQAALWGALRDEMPRNTWMQRIRAAFANELFLNAYDLDQQTMRDYAARLVRFRPRAFRGYVNPLVVFSRFLMREGLDTIRPHVVFIGAEALFEPQRDVIARAFRCPVRNAYGGRETGHMAAECPEDGRLHRFEETLYFEFLKDGKPVGRGESGEIVITDLKKRGMPLIRYDVEDLAVPSEEPCPCGRGLGTLERLEGRVQDVIVTPSSRFVAGQLFTHCFIDEPIVRFQVVQKEVGSVVVRIVPDSGFHDGVFRDVEQRLRDFIGDEMEIRFELVPSIELTRTGKHRFVISEIPTRT